MEPVLLDHSCDGIREYDNPMPFWWTAIFWITIAVCFPYIVYYHVGVGPSVQDEYESDVAEAVTAQLGALGDIQPDQETLLTLFDRTDGAKWKVAAKAMFRANCVLCHGPDGGGINGPNLTDDAYVNVGQVEDLFRVINNGVAGKGMPEWGKRFSKAQVILLATYVAQLRGTHPAQPKAADGATIPPWPVIKPDAAKSEPAQPAPK
jgi:cytochrome c oxidase cbb3-type subunit 3